MDSLIIKNLKALRCFHQLTQGQFADAIGVSESLISHLERGEREPSAGFVARVCQAFHLKPNTIFETDLLACALDSCGTETTASGENDEQQPR